MDAWGEILSNSSQNIMSKVALSRLGRPAWPLAGSVVGRFDWVLKFCLCGTALGQAPIILTVTSCLKKNPKKPVSFGGFRMSVKKSIKQYSVLVILGKKLKTCSYLTCGVAKREKREQKNLTHLIILTWTGKKSCFIKENGHNLLWNENVSVIWD